MPQLSAECFYDYCGECRDPACRDWCHQDEEFDPITHEWVARDDDEPVEVEW